MTIETSGRNLKDIDYFGSLCSEEYKEPKIGDYFSLLKPRVMSLVVFTAIIGMYLAPGEINPFIAIISILCVAIAAGASGGINMWYERDIDILMERTKNRPLPTGKITPSGALEFSVILAFFSVFIMAIAVNFVAAFILLISILFYVFIYTIWLKRRTAQNIVIGGAAGAFPPIIGWASVTAGVSLEPVILFLIIFMWTPPHFWSLSLYKCKDYTKAGIPMLPVVKGAKYTRLNILIYTILLSFTSLLPYLLSYNSYIYLAGVSLLNIVFINYAVKLYKKYDEKIAKKTFLFSLLYLFLLFLFLLIDKILL